MQFSYSYIQVHAVTYSYMQLHAVTCSYIQVHAVTYRCMQLHTVTCSYMQLHAVTYRCMQLHTGACSYIQVHAVTYSSMQLHTTPSHQYSCSSRPVFQEKKEHVRETVRHSHFEICNRIDSSNSFMNHKYLYHCHIPFKVYM